MFSMLVNPDRVPQSSRFCCSRLLRPKHVCSQAPQRSTILIFLISVPSLHVLQKYTLHLANTDVLSEAAPPKRRGQDPQDAV